MEQQHTINLLDAVKLLSAERKLPEEVIFEAIQEGLEIAAKKRLAKDSTILAKTPEVRVNIDPNSGEYVTYRRWLIVPTEHDEKEAEEANVDAEAEEANVDAEITLTEAQQRQAGDWAIGDWIEEEIESPSFTRISIQHAIPILKHKIDAATKKRNAEQFQNHIGDILQGQVQRASRDKIFIDLGEGAEAVLPKTHIIPREEFRNGDQVKALLVEIEEDPRYGPQLILDRRGIEMLKKLFHIEVPEIADGIIKIEAVARIAGSRAKIAVSTLDGRTDPVGTCVGMRGSRVQAVSGQLCNERIDIVLWDENPAYLAAQAIHPANVINASINIEQNTLDLVVLEEDLPQAIGHNGENVRLVEQLTGMDLTILSEEGYDHKLDVEQEKRIKLLTKQLDLDEDYIPSILVKNGYGDIEDIADADLSALVAIEDFGGELTEELAEELQNVVRITIAEEAAAKPKPELLELLDNSGLHKTLVGHLTTCLSENSIKTLEDFAGLATLELIDIMYPTTEASENESDNEQVEQTNEQVEQTIRIRLHEKQAGQLIMAARNKTLFADAKN